MPLILDKEMPVYRLLQQECPEALAIDSTYRESDVLHLLLLNLMSDKVGAELQYLRCLGTASQFIQVDFLRQVSYRSARQNEEYLQRFYLTEQDIAHRSYDGMIITGAPLEHISCEDTLYWEEFCRILHWSKTHVHSVFAGCWGAFAALYRDHGIAKTDLPQKLSGIYPLQVFHPEDPLFRNCGDPLCIPLSRATDMDLDAVLSCPEVILLASAQNGSPVYLKSRDNRYIYVTGHPEYERERLAFEYERDLGKCKDWNIPLPQNYFPDDDPSRQPHDRWVEPGQQMFRNWLTFYVDRKTAVHPALSAPASI